MKDSDQFLERYGSGGFPHAEELLPLLRAGALTVEGLEGEHCSLLEGTIYRVINRIKAGSAKPGAVQLPAQYAALADQFATSPDEPCCLWLFRTSGSSFWVFEMLTSKRIAGCFIAPDDSQVP